jgi:hypothetical protein
MVDCQHERRSRGGWGGGGGGVVASGRHTDLRSREVVDISAFIQRRASFVVEDETRGESGFHCSGRCVQLG